MTKLEVKFTTAKENKDKTDLLILGVYEEAFPKDKKAKLTGRLEELNDDLNGVILGYAELESFNAKLASCLVVPSLGKTAAKKILLVGLGSQKELKNLDQIRKATASAIRRADSQKAANVTIEIFGTESKLKIAEIARAITEVTLLAPYKFEKYLSKKEDEKKDSFKGIQQITLILPKDKANAAEQKLIKEETEKGIASAQGVLLARELIIEPPNVVNPAYLADVAQKAVKAQKDSRLTVKVLGEKECEKLKMGAFLAVGRGSKNESKLIHFHYKPKNKKGLKHVAIVGKGVTFDSGGLSLKPSKAMEKMKYDMAGSAAVIGLMSVITKISPEVEVTAIVAACENMPGGNAYRPGDVITSMSGKTIEINNTDAEGRVTLADSVYYACQQKPDHVIDIATLTGAIVVALGETAAGLMSNNKELTEEVKKAFEQSGEKVWEMPLYEDYEESVTKGTIADLLNAGSGGQAGSQNGALFIKHFVGNTPWVHLDIAGTCWPEKRDTFFTPRNNPAGFGVLSFIRHLENFG
ncbi:MAG: leucyl aminopeptidase [Candidatus Caenarcaniphilales bacterium]|nr:leucyl aminopeptidase [Candidatus Caenarcaniphilales bacterium]